VRASQLEELGDNEDAASSWDAIKNTKPKKPMMRRGSATDSARKHIWNPTAPSTRPPSSVMMSFVFISRTLVHTKVRRIIGKDL